MLNTSQSNTLYHAQTAYYLREMKKTKRYQSHEITSHTVEKSAQSRQEVELFIQTVFMRSYGATITEFMPTLVALRDENGVLMAAFGLREASDESLFLEQYLDNPIEQEVSRHLHRPITRNEITCIGNLAVSNPRNAGVFISHIIQYSLDIGVQWCVATAHHSLQNGLIKQGRDVYPLAEANPTRLSENEQKRWGSYYKQTPQIIAIRGNATPLALNQ